MSRLRTEIKQQKPFGSLHEEAFLALIRTADQLAAQEAELLKQFGLTPSQYNVLRILRGAGDDGHPCTEIGSRMIARVPDVTRLLDRLEAQGFVRRERSSADRRVVQVRILPPALEVLERLDGPIAGMAPALLAALSQREVKTLIELLDKLRAAAD